MHADAFNRQVQGFLKSHPYPVIVEADPERGKYTYRVQVKSAFPFDSVGPILGDAIHNFRSALDHIAWQLAVANNPKAAPGDDKVTQFPIFITEPGYAQRGEARTTRMAKHARTLIQAVQPYHNGDSAADHLLWLLSELDNMDKHKLVPVAVTSLESGEHTGLGLPVAGKSTVSIDFNMKPLEDGMEILKIALGIPQPDFDPKIKFSFGVIFAEPPTPGRWYVPELLAGFSSEVEYMIEVFSRAWAGGPYNDSALEIVNAR